MAIFKVDGNELVFAFTPLEAVGGLRTGARMPLAQIQEATVVSDPWSILSGVRVGTAIPRIIILGTMLREGPNDVVAVYRQKPAVVVTFKPGAAYQRFIGTVPEPERIVEEIRSILW